MNFTYHERSVSVTTVVTVEGVPIMEGDGYRILPDQVIVYIENGPEFSWQATVTGYMIKKNDQVSVKRAPIMFGTVVTIDPGVDAMPDWLRNLVDKELVHVGRSSSPGVTTS